MERDRTDADKAEMLLSQAMEGFHKKLVVLDDDPTGVQTVHDVSVYTDWKKNLSAMALRKKKEAMFFILTNSRSFSVEETTKVHRYCRKSGEGCQRAGTGLHDHFPWRFHTERSLSAGNMPWADGLTKERGRCCY